MEEELKSKVIRMAWEDRTTFETISKSLGIQEAEVIKIMRQELKKNSFKLWRKRVSGRRTKHGKVFKSILKDRKQGRGNKALQDL